MKRRKLTQIEQVYLQKTYINTREAIQYMMHINRDRKLNFCLNKLFDSADIMYDYIESTKEENGERD